MISPRLCLLSSSLLCAARRPCSTPRTGADCAGEDIILLDAAWCNPPAAAMPLVDDDTGSALQLSHSLTRLAATIPGPPSIPEPGQAPHSEVRIVPSESIEQSCTLVGRQLASQALSPLACALRTRTWGFFPVVFTDPQLTTDAIRRPEHQRGAVGDGNWYDSTPRMLLVGLRADVLLAFGEYPVLALSPRLPPIPSFLLGLPGSVPTLFTPFYFALDRRGSHTNGSAVLFTLGLGRQTTS
ncbi:hypothetical protein C8R46DRAFT_1044597 [Mycena filopes]|nr:hypothetical protein C8R46DRAFT_1044597 [Mycena filopes]